MKQNGKKAKTPCHGVFTMDKLWVTVHVQLLFSVYIGEFGHRYSVFGMGTK